ncbi:catalase [Algoriphagus litoralis]|uniref:catalase n=1 Tax=Algoriphagus litoralis TaxID=2202829 RepID=UPI000DBA137E|nr:catalase [Algoriphagus litoralis]
MDTPNKKENEKTRQLSEESTYSKGEFMTSNQGVRIVDDQNSLKAGPRGGTLMDDFHFREKMTHFDHERIPERVVHARGSGAHGHFELIESMAEFTTASFLQEPGTSVPVFVRFSTVGGSKGSTDLARDVRGFSTKFYTQEGNYDLVGNNIPVFFIQDAMKFPDLVHSLKPESDNGIPQASSAHDTFWDLISLMPESMHMIMWLMSDRALPRSYRMMEGFGVHTFRFINKDGKSTFVKFHWKPVLGAHSVAWDEAQKISGKDSDFHRRDLWNAIEDGNYPEFHLGVQLVPEEDEHKFDFDLLDPTKLIPEEEVPVKIIGKMTLTENPKNFFAETEQVAFHPGHLVPGIDFTNDPLLQGRLFSYTDTQLIRLGGPNFHEIPINQPVIPIHNNQRDGFSRRQIPMGKGGYHPNTMAAGCPFQAGQQNGGFTHYAERIDAHKVRERSPSFRDHFSQAKLFYNSQSEYEKGHILAAFLFELGKVTYLEIRERITGLLLKVDKELAEKVAEGLGMPHIPEPEYPLNHSFPADADPADYQPKSPKSNSKSVKFSPALSMKPMDQNPITSRKIALLVSNGFDQTALDNFKKAVMEKGGKPVLISSRQGDISDTNGGKVRVNETFKTSSSVLFDAVYVLGGEDSEYTQAAISEEIEFIEEAFKHCKPIGFSKKGTELFASSRIGVTIKENAGPHATFSDLGVFTDSNPLEFIKALGKHRFWEREAMGLV